ncbi:hypothetical protein OAS39_13745, partial [Pirellulales bacterium]|nr:hypothetical protein [Pirellulales bacterium]
YHVTNLLDYNSELDEQTNPRNPAPRDSLRRRASNDRVRRLRRHSAGLHAENPQQQSLDCRTNIPRGGITLYDYPVEISIASDVVVRYLRVRTGDFHAVGTNYHPSRGNRVLPGVDDLPEIHRPDDFDVDRDGIADEFETRNGLNPGNASDNQAYNLSSVGLTKLDVYLNNLTKQSDDLQPEN